MSIKTQTVKVPPVPATTREQPVGVTCDLCGASIPCTFVASDGSVDWTGGYEVANTTVSLTEGFRYDGNGHLEFRAYHLCPNCFKTKLEPWLVAQGAAPTLHETDY
jgi:hypothetical protein